MINHYKWLERICVLCCICFVILRKKLTAIQNLNFLVLFLKLLQCLNHNNFLSKDPCISFPMQCLTSERSSSKTLKFDLHWIQFVFITYPSLQIYILIGSRSVFFLFFKWKLQLSYPYKITLCLLLYLHFDCLKQY